MTFEAQNKLEQSLMRAAQNAADAPQFYQELVRSDILIINESGQSQKSAGDTQRRLSITTIDFEGTRCIPIFSSLPRLQSMIDRQVDFVAINALQFLKMTQGQTLVLNPGSDFGKTISANEAAAIIDGSILRSVDTQSVAQGTAVRLGEPAIYPQKLADVLTSLFIDRSNVLRAWIAHYQNPAEDEKAHTLVAIEIDGDYEVLMSEVVNMAQQVDVPDPPIDFLPLTGQGGIEDYFLHESTPFYRRP